MSCGPSGIRIMKSTMCVNCTAASSSNSERSESRFIRRSHGAARPGIAPTLPPSRLAAEADKVVQFQRISPGFDVFAGPAEFRDVAGENLQRLGIAVRAAAIHVITPL